MSLPFLIELFQERADFLLIFVCPRARGRTGMPSMSSFAGGRDVLLSVNTVRTLCVGLNLAWLLCIRVRGVATGRSLLLRLLLILLMRLWRLIVLWLLPRNRRSLVIPRLWLKGTLGRLRLPCY